MSLQDLLEFELARVTIEAESPFLVGVEEGDGFHDATFSSDANGLPTIPGDTLAGILRHALAAGGDPATDDRCKAAFGFQESDEGRASAVEVSWAHVHDQYDRPVPFRGARVEGDPVLAFLGAGVTRDHVRLDMNGVAAKTGKFDVLLVPAGARFTFELRVLGRAGVTVDRLLGLIALPETGIGRASLRGLGRFRVVAAEVGRFDLREKADRARWERMPVGIHEPVPRGILVTLSKEEATAPPAEARRWADGEILLNPRSSWYVGGTTPPEDLRDDQASDRFPWGERRILWDGDRGKVSEQGEWLLPASSLKGALRHRVAFHARRLAEVFVDPAQGPTDEACAAPAAEAFWFGEIRDVEGGRPGRIRLSDGRVARRSGRSDLQRFQHVSIDRFTQGPMDGRLFDEVALFGTSPMRISIAVDDEGADDVARGALKAALVDLVEGRLWLGAAGSRGHGAMQGDVKWNNRSPFDGGAA